MSENELKFLEAQLEHARKVAATVPRIIERGCGGWLAVAPEDGPFRVAVTADTAEEARVRLDRELKEWEALRAKSDSRSGGGSGTKRQQPGRRSEQPQDTNPGDSA